MTTENFEKLISKRDGLLKRNLNKELKLAQINLKKDIKENETPKNNFTISNNKPENPFANQKKVLAPMIVREEKAGEMKNPGDEKPILKNENSGNKKGIFSFLKKERETIKGNISKETPPEKIIKKKIDNKKIKEEKLKVRVRDMKKPCGVKPTKGILEKEMEIDRRISREVEPRLEKEFSKKKKQRRKLKISSEEEVKKEIVKNSAKHVSRLSGEVNEIARDISQLKGEVRKSVVGQEGVIDAFICAILCDGHVLLEGVPGVAKTLIVKTLAEASGCSSNRIQFTVDLLPSDILGITTYTPQKGFETIRGPIFSNFIVADEINRSPPKTQSAMIEAMQEKQVTIGKQTFKLPLPFFVMANNNPLEQSGVYDLPEAQIDRFLFKLLIGYPENKEEVKIMEENMTIKKFESFGVKPVLSPQKITRMQQITKEIYVDERIKEYIVRIIDKTRKRDFENGQFIEWGGSPRASIGLFIASKAWALMNGRAYVIPKDVKDIAHYVLRHRVILNYRAKAEKLTSDRIIDEILDMIEV
ncbi:MAG: MoxR family ATPase [Candidatus Pacearchaeota archaeon]|jgi:MoxR-like ATPase